MLPSWEATAMCSPSKIKSNKFILNKLPVCLDYIISSILDVNCIKKENLFLSLGAQNFMAAKLKVYFFIFLWVTLLIPQVTLRHKNSINFLGGNESFGFNKLSEFVCTLVLFTSLFDRWNNFTLLQALQNT